MRIPIKLSEGAKVPTQATPGSNAYDLYSTEDARLEPNGRAAISTGVHLAIPTGYVGLVCPRSGLAIKSGVTVINAPGVVDSDYRGEIKALVINHNIAAHEVKKNDRVAQILFVKTEEVQFDLASELSNTVRDVGGFGSTGK